MNVLLDECVPRKLKRDIPYDNVSSVPEMGWAGIKNGALLDMAETTFDVFITVDQGLIYEQNIGSRSIAVILLIAADNRLATLRPLMPSVVAALETIQPGEIVRIQM
jgi:hypothetical protein